MLPGSEVMHLTADGLDRTLHRTAETLAMVVVAEADSPIATAAAAADTEATTVQRLLAVVEAQADPRRSSPYWVHPMTQMHLDQRTDKTAAAAERGPSLNQNRTLRRLERTQ